MIEKLEIIMMVIVILLSIITLFNPKIRVIKILRGHFSTYENDNTNKASFFDYICFVVFPIILSCYLVVFKNLEIHDINILLTVFSIFTALLFNFLMLIIQVKDNPINETNKPEGFDENKYNKLVNQTYYNVSFAIILSILAIVIIWILSILPEGNKREIRIITIVSLSVMIAFFLDLLMILKRIFSIYQHRK